ncbi:Holliday junction branch migration protein RuvA [Acetohalobium arabaticum]|uniref:Holliday junction branch migration complex subunit RuvA n=1 Tax=Acetohalobium arabaticum (strain ATCC 49924 / DSM 5501 / Z-7288) TaxID=574087 RepID=D9QVI3_ACEAZ|nr:Holliday junction branch migration protein RuvA [Acetohalobium arabaticum]ADL12242.1 Holliday junction DNA helicase RuvA [Acetohalobium arabaticum DSM 5501]
MIAHLTGELVLKEEARIVIDVQGVGYEVMIPTSVQNRLPNIGEDIKVYTHTYVREDRFVLYGFLQLSELELFGKLLKVSKVGPKVAVSILSTLNAREFKLAVAKEDIEVLKEVKGIGKKTAQRLILEMKGKIDLDRIMEEEESSQSVDGIEREEAVEGLMNLGYNIQEAREAVTEACKGVDEAAGVEEVIKLALQKFGQND